MSDHTLRYYAAQLGRKGGKAGTGKSKTRSSAQARAAVNERWRRYRERQHQKGPR